MLGSLLAQRFGGTYKNRLLHDFTNQNRSPHCGDDVYYFCNTKNSLILISDFAKKKAYLYIQWHTWHYVNSEVILFF